jgi:cytochrome c oxidase subunit 2
MTPDDAGAAPAGPSQPPASNDGARHWTRIIVVWLVVSAVSDSLFYFWAGPHIPPGRMSSTASGAQFDFNVLLAIALPVMLGVWIFMIYAIVEWRASRDGPEPVGGASARSNLPIQTTWITLTSVIVLFLAGFGTYEVVQPEGSGGGQGPAPIWTPTSHSVLPIQVIGQQWKFTFRYPTFGGFETDQLVVPDNTTIAFHITSLDVIHDFWAYQLGVKADANPGQDNVAYTTPKQLGTFSIRCNELCGIWHGAMFTTGKVETPSQFNSWATSTEVQLAANTKNLPPFAWSYIPDANGANGGYYPDNKDPYSPVETYGAPQPGTPTTTAPKK